MRHYPAPPRYVREAEAHPTRTAVRQFSLPTERRKQTAETRFESIKPHASREQAALEPGHPALKLGRTRFKSRSVPSAWPPRVLIDGHNNCKIGREVRKGPWRGCRVYTLTLEERATCPRSCHVWAECYGNAMHWPRRHAADANLIPAIDRDLSRLARLHPAGVVVRLHILGDFFSVAYVAAWAAWMMLFPKLHVFGFTAHARDTEIGAWIEAMNREWPHRWVIRFSGAPETPPALRQATTIWRKPTASVESEGIICPAQTRASTSCTTCGLCWAPAAAGKRIVFVGHGRKKRGGDVDAAAL